MRDFKDKIAFLPEPLRDRCIKAGNETGWRKNDVVDVIKHARDSSLATLGGQIQYRFPDATCELYWLSYDPSSRRPNEDWTSYCQRSAAEAISKFRNLPDPAEIREHAKGFPAIKDKLEQGIDIDEYQVFILYFVDEVRYQTLGDSS